MRLASIVRHPCFSMLCIAFILRLALWAQPLHEPANDEVEYIAVARDLIAGRGWVFYDTYRWLRAPLYPLFLAGSLWLTNGDLYRAALPNLLLSTTNIGLAYLLTRKLIGSGPARLAALISLLLWTNVTFASLYMAETLFTFLFSIALIISLYIPKTSRPLLLASIAGLVYGLAALTRSAILPFIPITAIWIWINIPRSNPMNRSYQSQLVAQLLPSLLFLVATALTIAPWTIRNTLAYGRPILVETGLSYNLWAFNEPKVELDTIHRTLEAIPNPADRADFATAQGLEHLREDPAILTRKIWPNWVFLTRVKPIQDRFLMESYYDSIDFPLFTAALIFDDILYILIALSAIGFILLPAQTKLSTNTHNLQSHIQSPTMLIIAWLMLCIGTFLLTHGEARYRHFLFPLLIPYSAACIWEFSKPGLWQRVRSGFFSSTWPIRSMAVLALTWIFVWNIATSYPYSWAAENLTRGWYTLIGDLARRIGQPQAAINAYRAAAEAQRAPDPLLRLGDTARTMVDTDTARNAYRSAQLLIPAYVPSAARLGDLLRALGDQQGARASFAAPYIDQQMLSDWAWRNLHSIPEHTIDIGGGLDIGYTNGLFPAEILAGATARWSGPHASILIGLPPNNDSQRNELPSTGFLTLRLAAPQSLVHIQICTSQRCQMLSISPAWRTYRIPIAINTTEVIELYSPTFLAPDGRQLGILIDTITLTR